MRPGQGYRGRYALPGSRDRNRLDLGRLSRHSWAARAREPPKRGDAVLTLLIRNARICDGTGAPSFMGELGVQDGLIRFVGPRMARPRRG